jgi:hypothetical protein
MQKKCIASSCGYAVEYKAMTAELRIVGNKLVLYTDDNHLYRRLHKGINPIYKVPYFQNDRLVGYDLYFERKFRRTIVRIMKGQTAFKL